eukprot:scaffold15059_cov146-Skeletonema_menzelii.AAC.7
MNFTGHRDVKCRENAVLALGNLCSNPVHVKRLVDVKCADALVAYSFPTTAEESVNAQFQAIAGLHGLSKHAELRAPLLREGGLEPLILGLRSDNNGSHIEIRRESAAALNNMALARETKMFIAKSGALPALKDLLKSEDSICRNHASSALANLAESNGIHELLLDDCCLCTMCNHVNDIDCCVDTKRAISRCLALFASNSQVHEHLLTDNVLTSLQVLIAATADRHCERCGMLGIANLATDGSNHQVVLGTIGIGSILSLAQSEDVETLRSLSFALHSFSTNKQTHAILMKANAADSLVPLLMCDDYDTSFQACLAAKYLCTSDSWRNAIAESKGLEALLSLASGHDLELKRELTSTLQNMTLSDDNKGRIMANDGMKVIANLCRDSDSIVSHQACGTVANIAERQANKVVMVKQGIILHLQFAVLAKFIPVLRESMRALANLSSASENASDILASSALSLIIKSLRCDDVLCSRYAAMAMSNLSSLTEDSCRQIVKEEGIPPLMSLVQQQTADSPTQQYATTCLANLASYGLVLGGCAQASIDHIKSMDLDLRASVLLFVANLASNATSRALLEAKSGIADDLIDCLECKSRLVQMHALDALRGLSTSSSVRGKIISSGGLESLLAFVHSDDSDLKQKAVLALCNLSLSGTMSDRANTVLQKVDIQLLIGFLCNETQESHRMFGAMAIGNIASNLDFHYPILKSGALDNLIGLSEVNGSEPQRCMALAICNLAVQPEIRSAIVNSGGLSSIMYLCHTNDPNDTLVGISTLRAFCTSDYSRRAIFEEGVLHVLLLALNIGCLACKRKVSSMLALLSLNHQNKFDLARSEEIKEFMCLLKSGDTHCVSLFCRCIGSICEVKELHPHVLNVLSLEELPRPSSDTDPKVAKEVVRCYANLSSNSDYHTAIVTPTMIKNLIAFCCHSDSDVRRLSSLTISNLSANEMNTALKGKDMLRALNNIIGVHKVLDSSGNDIESKCYACMAIGSLASTDEAVGTQFVSMGLIPSLLQLLSVEDEQLNLCAVYLVDKLSLHEDTHPRLHVYRTVSHLINHEYATELPHIRTYSIGAIRRLCENTCTDIEHLMVKETTEFMASSCDFGDIERCRQIVSGICHLSLRHEAKSEILNSKAMMGSLIDLSKMTDLDVCRFALGSIANIADDNQFCRVISLSQLTVTSLLHALDSEDTTIVRETSRVIANLLSSTEFQAAILKEGGVSSIIRISLFHDYECVRNAVLSLRKLAANKASHGILFSQEGVGVIMHLVGHDDLQIRVQSASALRDISTNGDFQLAIKDCGVVGVAMELACQPEIELKILAMGILRRLSVAMNLKKELLNGAIIDVLTVCVESSDSEALLFECASFIANLAEHAQNKVGLVQMGMLHRLTSLSKHGSVKVKQNSARAFALISSTPRNHNNFVGSVLDALIGLLQCQDEETCRNTAAAIANIAANDEISARIGNLGGVYPLVLLLKSSDDSCQRNACHAMSRLTTVEENKLSMLSCNGIDYLIPLCVSKHEGVSVFAAMVLCNLSSCSSGHEHEFVREDLIRRLGRIASGDCPVSSKYAIMSLCNLTSMCHVRDHVARGVDLTELFGWMMKEESNTERSVYTTMLVCNLSSVEKHRVEILSAGGLHCLENIAANVDDIHLQRVILLTLYNISACDDSRAMIAQSSLMQFIGVACRSRDLLCQRCAIMTLSNIASSDETRNVATRGGGLQAAIICLEGYDTPLQRFGLACLANMSSDEQTQSQIVVHGGLHSIVNLSREGDVETRECALLCLSNLCANDTVHSSLVDQDVLSVLVGACKDHQSITALFALANLTSGDKFIHDLDADEGMVLALIDLVRSSDNKHKQCLAISALRRLASSAKNKAVLFQQGILLTLANAKNSKDRDLRREIASCLCALSLSSRHRLDMAQIATPMLIESAKSNDSETVRLSLSAIANVAVESNTHPVLCSADAIESIIHRLSHALTGIKREAIRSISNLLTSVDLHPTFIRHDVIECLIQLQTAGCEDCDCLAALSFSKLSVSTGLSNEGLKYVLTLLKSKHKITRKYAATALRNLCASSDEESAFFKLGIPELMIEVLNGKETDLDVLAAATLRSLSCSSIITDKFADNGILYTVIRSISKATVELKSQIAAIFANLSEHLQCQPVMISRGVVKAIDGLSTNDHGDTLKVRYPI